MSSITFQDEDPININPATGETAISFAEKRKKEEQSYSDFWFDRFRTSEEDDDNEDNGCILVGWVSPDGRYIPKRCSKASS